MSGNAMDMEYESRDYERLLDRIRQIEGRIETLEAKITEEYNFFLEEDLKARGFK